MAEKEEEISEVEKWKSKLDRAGKYESHWRNEARACQAIYLNRNPKDTATATMYGNTLSTVPSASNHKTQSNIFYSNVCFSRSSILTKMPEIIIRERYSKQNSDMLEHHIAFNTIADIVQRSATVMVDNNYNNKELRKFKTDVLITGRGILWVLFDSTTDPITNEVAEENIKLKRIGLNDFRMSPAREWEEVSWIARRILLDKKTIEDQYGKEAAKEISYTYPNTEDKLDISEEDSVSFEERAEVWEVWDKIKKEVIFVCMGYDKLLAKVPDPYQLDGFFPTPEPLLSIPKNDSLIPTPEYNIYRSEAVEVARTSARITNLIAGMKARAFLPNTLVKSIKDIKTATDNDFVLLDGPGAQAYADRGMSGVIQFEPIEQRASVVDMLGNQMDRQKQTIFEITGLSDAMQISNALATSGGDAETATKTIMKGKFGSIRLQEKQHDFNEYIKEVFYIVCEFICSKVSMATMQEITEIKLNDGSNPEDVSITWDDAMNYMRNSKMANYLLEVETDMNIWESDSEAQQTRAQMVEMFTEQLQKISQMAKDLPTAIDFYVKSCTFVLDSYQMPSSLRNNLEEVLNQMAMEMKQKAEQDKVNPPPPQGEELLAQAENTKAQAMAQDIQVKAELGQGELELKKMAQENEMQLAQAKSQDVQVDAQVRMEQIQLERYKIQTDYEIAMLDIQYKMRQLDIDKEGAAEKEQVKIAAIKEKMQSKQAQLQMEYETKNRKLSQDTDIQTAILTQKTLSAREKLAAEKEMVAAKELSKHEDEDDDLMGG
jgi:hypothetical protein